MSQQIIRLGEEWERRLREAGASPSALRMAQFVHQTIAFNADQAKRWFDASGSEIAKPTVYEAIRVLESTEIIREITGRARNRVWLAPELVRIIEPVRPAAPA